MNTSRRGMVLVMVIFFIFAVSIGLFMLTQTNTLIGTQTRSTLRQLQAYYIAQSGLQHQLLKLKLLPREAYEAMKTTAGAQEFAQDVKSDNDMLLAFRECSPAEADAFTLFDASTSPPQRSPYPAEYVIEELQPGKSHLNMKFAQDSYVIRVKAVVNAHPKAEDVIEEEVIISRYTGVGGP